MATLAIVTLTDRPDVRQALIASYGSAVHIVDDRIAYLRTDDSARAVYDNLKLDSLSGNVLILGLSGDYWGRNARANWDWLKRSFETAGD